MEVGSSDRRGGPQTISVDGLNAFSRQITDPLPRGWDRRPIFSRACALGVVQRMAEPHLRGMWSILQCHLPAGKPVPSHPSLGTEYRRERAPRLPSPGLFWWMRSCDKVSGTPLARSFVDLVTLMILPPLRRWTTVPAPRRRPCCKACADTLPAVGGWPQSE